MTDASMFAPSTFESHFGRWVFVQFRRRLIGVDDTLGFRHKTKAVFWIVVDPLRIKLVVVLAYGQINGPVSASRVHVDLHLAVVEWLTNPHAVFLERREAFQVVRFYFADVPRLRRFWQAEYLGIKVSANMATAQLNAYLPAVFLAIDDIAAYHPQVVYPSRFFDVTGFEDPQSATVDSLMRRCPPKIVEKFTAAFVGKLPSRNGFAVALFIRLFVSAVYGCYGGRCWLW